MNPLQFYTSLVLVKKRIYLCRSPVKLSWLHEMQTELQTLYDMSLDLQKRRLLLAAEKKAFLDEEKDQDSIHPVSQSAFDSLANDRNAVVTTYKPAAFVAYSGTGISFPNTPCRVLPEHKHREVDQQTQYVLNDGTVPDTDDAMYHAAVKDTLAKSYSTEACSTVATVTQGCHVGVLQPEKETLYVSENAAHASTTNCIKFLKLLTWHCRFETWFAIWNLYKHVNFHFASELTLFCASWRSTIRTVSRAVWYSNTEHTCVISNIGFLCGFWTLLVLKSKYRPLTPPKPNTYGDTTSYPIKCFLLWLTAILILILQPDRLFMNFLFHVERCGRILAGSVDFDLFMKIRPIHLVARSSLIWTSRPTVSVFIQVTLLHSPDAARDNLCA